MTALAFFAVGFLITGLNFYLSCIRVPLLRRLQNRETVPPVSGIPLIGSVALWISVMLLPAGNSLIPAALVASLFDTGGIHWFVGTLTWQYLRRTKQRAPMTMKRNRFLYFAVGCLVVALGLASRRYAALLPAFFAQYAGDTLWAVMVFVGVGLLVPRWSSYRVAVIALAVSFAIEMSQLYHASWIDTLRHTRVGGLVLGYGFLWSDLACYAVGVTLSVVIETWVSKVYREP